MIGTRGESETPTAAALRAVFEHTGHAITTAPAEGTDRVDWVIHILQRREAHPDLTVLKRCRYYDQDPMTLWSGSAILRPRRGMRLTPAALSLGYADYARAAWPVFRELAPNYRQVRLQVGIPGPTDLAAMSWGPWALARYKDEVDAALIEIAQIHDLTGGQAVYQVELPVPTYLVWKAPRSQRTKLADRLGRAVAEFIAKTPVGTAWILHPCTSDPHGKPLTVPADASVMVDLVNGIYAHWPSTQVLDAVHLPLCEGLHSASIDLAYYGPLAELDVPKEVHVSAGVVRAADTVDRMRLALDAAEQMANRGQLGVSCPCGMGRRPADVGVIMDRLVALANS